MNTATANARHIAELLALPPAFMGRPRTVQIVTLVRVDRSGRGDAVEIEVAIDALDRRAIELIGMGFKPIEMSQRSAEGSFASGPNSGGSQSAAAALEVASHA